MAYLLDYSGLSSAERFYASRWWTWNKKKTGIFLKNISQTFLSFFVHKVSKYLDSILKLITKKSGKLVGWKLQTKIKLYETPVMFLSALSLLFRRARKKRKTLQHFLDMRTKKKKEKPRENKETSL